VKLLKKAYLKHVENGLLDVGRPWLLTVVELDLSDDSVLVREAKWHLKHALILLLKFDALKTLEWLELAWLELALHGSKTDLVEQEVVGTVIGWLDGNEGLDAGGRLLDLRWERESGGDLSIESETVLVSNTE
jgi:hypothetical protein